MKTLSEQITNYYADQLANIKPGRAGSYAPKIKITQTLADANSGREAVSAATKWFDLNQESAQELVKFLQSHFEISPERSFDFNNYNLLKLTYGNDKDGKRYVRIFSERFKSSVKVGRYYKSPNLTEKEHDNISDCVQVAKIWLKDHGFNVIGYAEARSNDYDFLICDTFQSFKGIKRLDK
jgi:hypothetical protein